MFCGWDWGSTVHGVCLIDDQGAVVKRWMVQHTGDQLMRLKIAMRETEHQPRSRTPILGDGSHDCPDGADAIGRNEGTVRFLFGPHGGA